MLKTPRLTLVPLNMSHLNSTHRYSSDRENCLYMFQLPRESEEETRLFLRSCEAEWKKPAPTFYEFAVLLEKEHIGAVSLHLQEDGFAELGWIIEKSHWGHGYAFEAAEALLDFAVNRRNLRHFRAHCDSRNAASRHIMEKLGMSLISTTYGRKNRACEELGEECLYELLVRLA